MKKVLKTMLIIAMLLCVVITISGCGKKEEGEPVVDDRQPAVNNKETSLRGEWQGKKYVNSFAKLQFNLPENWVVTNDEDLATMMNIAAETLGNDAEITKLAETGTLYCMVVNDPSTASSVMMMVEKRGGSLTAEDYLKTIEQQLKTTTSMKYNLGEQTKQTIGGDEYTALSATVGNGDVKQNYFVKNEGDYIVGIVITTLGELDAKTVLNYFE